MTLAGQHKDYVCINLHFVKEYPHTSIVILHAFVIRSLLSTISQNFQSSSSEPRASLVKEQNGKITV